MKSLTTKFIIFIIVPVTLILSVLSITSYIVARNLLIDQIKLSGLNFLSASSSQMSGRITQIQSVLSLLAATENLAEMNDDQRRRLFVTLKEQLGGSVTSVFMGFSDGKFIRAKTTALPDDYDPRIRPWYLEAIQRPPGVPDGVTSPYTDASTKRPTLTVYHKVNDHAGKLVGVLGVDVDIVQASGDLIIDDPFLSKGRLILVNADAVVLLHPNVSRVGLRLDATGEEMDHRIATDIRNRELAQGQYVDQRMNTRWYMGFSRTIDARTVLVLSGPATGILKPLLLLTYKMAALGLVIVIALFVLLWVVARKISKPIIDLNTSAKRVTQDGTYADPIKVKSADEVGQLTTAFNEMMEGLRQRDFIRDTFGRYVTKEVVEELLDTSDGLKLGGEIKEVTIMFSDLRGFTPLSEKLPPHQVIEILNDYLSRMSTIIGKYKGTINEFIGDAILTIFGAPIKHGDSPGRAVACALAMQLEMETVNRENFEKGLPPLSMGIGINTGDVIVGNIGSQERAKYGVVGHQINLASRVEGATVGGQILITPSTHERIKEVVITHDVRSVTFKGVEEEIALYDVIGMKAPYDLRLADRPVESAPLKTKIAVRLCRMKDKQAVLPEMSAQLTHYAYPTATVTSEEKLDPLQEVRMVLAGKERAEEIYLYARITRVVRQADGYVHGLQISYLTSAAKQLIERSI